MAEKTSLSVRAVVVRRPVLNGPNETSRGWRLLVPAWVLSGAVHLVLLALFLGVNVQLNADAIGTEISVLQTEVASEATQQEPNLLEDELGPNPDDVTSIDVKRLEDLNVPAPLNPADALGTGTPVTEVM